MNSHERRLDALRASLSFLLFAVVGIAQTACNLTIDDLSVLFNTPRDLFVPPPDPVGLVVERRYDRSLKLKWSSGRGTTVGFRMAYRSGPLAPENCASNNVIDEDNILEGGGLSYVVSDLSSDTEYSFRLCAINADDPPDVSAGITVSGRTLAEPPQDNPVPPNPMGVRVAQSFSNGFRLEWQNGGGSMVGCRIAYAQGVTAPTDCSSGNIISESQTQGQSSFMLSGLDGYQQYSFRFCGVNADLPPDVSNGVVVSGMTLDGLPPNPDNIRVLSLSSSSLRVEWSYSNQSNLSKVSGYKLAYNPSSPGNAPANCDSGLVQNIASNSQLSATVSGLQASVNYAFRVCALNRNMPADASSGLVGFGMTSAPVVMRPADPVNVQAQALSATSIRVSLGQPNSSVPIAGYIIAYNVNQAPNDCTSGTIVSIPGSASTSRDISGLANNTTYGFRVCSYDQSSPPVQSLGVTVAATTGTPLPPDPINVQASALSPFGIRLTLQSSGGSTAGFMLAYNQGSVPANCLSGSILNIGLVSQYDLLNLMPATSYGIRVCAINAANPVGYSQGIGVTAMTNVIGSSPDPQNVVVSSLSTSSIRVNWSPVANSNLAGFIVAWNQGQAPSNCDQQQPPSNTPSFAQVKPLLLAKCANCHSGIINDAMTESSIFASGWVAPGSPQASKVYYRLAGSGAPNGNMPLLATAYTAAELALIRDWVTNFGSGSQVALSRQVLQGAQVSSYDIASLSPGATYGVRVCSFNIANPPQNSPGVVSSGMTKELPPADVAALQAAAQSSSLIRLSWNLPSGSQSLSMPSSFTIAYDLNAAPANCSSGTQVQVAVPAGTAAGAALSRDITNLNPNALYGFRICSRNNNVPAELSSGAVASVRTQDLPAPPDVTNVQAQALSSTSMRISWVSGGGSTAGYVVAYQSGMTAPACPSNTPPSGVSVIQVNSAATLSADVANLSSNSFYAYRVCAKDGATPPRLSSGNQSFASARTLDVAPPNPSNLVATAVSTNTIRLTWVSGGQNTSGFYLVMSNNLMAPASCVSNSAIALLPSATSYDAMGLQASMDYSFRLCSYNSSMPPLVSSGIIASARTQDPPPPAQVANPVNVTAAGNSPSSILVSWSAPAGGAALKYRIAYQEGSAPNDCASGIVIGDSTIQGVSHVISGLRVDTVHGVRVCSVDLSNSPARLSSGIALNNVRTNKEGAPAEVTNVVASVMSAQSALLSWSNPANSTIRGNRIVYGLSMPTPVNCAAAQGFNVVSEGMIAANSYSFMSLTPGTTYYARVCSINGNNPPDASNGVAVSFSLPMQGLPPNPSDFVAASLSTSSIRLNWSPVQNSSPTVSHYRVSYLEGAAAPANCETPMSQSGPTFAEIKAMLSIPNKGCATCHGAGSMIARPFLADADVSTWEGPAGAPLLVRGQPLNSRLYAKIVGSLPNNIAVVPNMPPQGFGFANLTVAELSMLNSFITNLGSSTPPSGGTAPTLLTVNGAASSALDVTGLLTGRSYSFRLCSGTADNPVKLSSGVVASSSTLDNLAPPNPSNPTANALSSSSIQLAWQSGGGSTSSFLIAWSQGMNAPASCQGGTQVANSPFTAQNLSPNTQYSFRICAQDNSSPVRLSAGVTISATTLDLAPPPEPSFAQAVPSSNAVMLSWNSGAGTTAGFRLSYATGLNAPPEFCTTNPMVGESVLTASILNYTLMNLTAQTDYSFRLCAVDNNNPRRVSRGVTISSRTQNIAPPTNPVGLQAQAASDSVINLTWMSGGGSTASYIVARMQGATAPASCAQAPGVTVVSDITNLSHTASGLSASTAYSFRVCAASAGASPLVSSGAVAENARTMAIVIPPDPRNIITQSSISSIIISWDTPLNYLPSGYVIAYGAQPTTIPTSCAQSTGVIVIPSNDITGTTKTINNLLAGTSFNIRVCSVHQNYPLVLSQGVLVSTATLSQSIVATDEVANFGVRNITYGGSGALALNSRYLQLRWDDEIGLPAKGYRISFRQGALPPSTCNEGTVISEELLPGSSRDALIGPLNPETQYTFRICKLSNNNQLSTGEVFYFKTNAAPIETSPYLLFGGDQHADISYSKVTHTSAQIRIKTSSGGIQENLMFSPSINGFKVVLNKRSGGSYNYPLNDCSIGQITTTISGPIAIFNIQNLEPNSQYLGYICPINAAGTRTYAMRTLSFSTAQDPQIAETTPFPENFSTGEITSAYPGRRYIWIQHGIQSSQDLIGYKISYSQGQTPPATCSVGNSVGSQYIPLSVKTFGVGPLLASTQYSFRICPIKTSLIMLEGKTLTATTLADTGSYPVGTYVQMSNVIPTETSLEFFWAPEGFYYGAPSPTGFRIAYSTTRTADSCTSGTIIPESQILNSRHKIENLVPGTRYFVKICGVDSSVTPNVISSPVMLTRRPYFLNRHHFQYSLPDLYTNGMNAGSDPTADIIENSGRTVSLNLNTQLSQKFSWANGVIVSIRQGSQAPNPGCPEEANVKRLFSNVEPVDPSISSEIRLSEGKISFATLPSTFYSLRICGLSGAAIPLASAGSTITIQTPALNAVPEPSKLIVVPQLLWYSEMNNPSISMTFETQNTLDYQYEYSLLEGTTPPASCDSQLAYNDQSRYFNNGSGVSIINKSFLRVDIKYDKNFQKLKEKTLYSYRVCATSRLDGSKSLGLTGTLETLDITSTNPEIVNLRVVYGKYSALEAMPTLEWDYAARGGTPDRFKVAINEGAVVPANDCQTGDITSGRNAGRITSGQSQYASQFSVRPESEYSTVYIFSRIAPTFYGGGILSDLPLKYNTSFTARVCVLYNNQVTSSRVITFRTKIGPEIVQNISQYYSNFQTQELQSKRTNLTWTQGPLSHPNLKTAILHQAGAIAPTCETNTPTDQLSTGVTSYLLSGLNPNSNYSVTLCGGANIEIVSNYANDPDSLLGGSPYFTSIFASAVARSLSFLTPALSPPPEPQNVSASSSSSVAINLAWTSGGGSTFGFKVAYQLGALPPISCNSGTQVDLNNGTSAIINNLLPDTLYAFRVCAYDQDPPRLYSNGVLVSARTQRVAAPNNASNLQVVSQSPSQLIVSWINGGGTTSGFQLAYKPGLVAPINCTSDGTLILPRDILGNAHLVTGLQASTDYAFRVCSVNGNNPPDFSVGAVGTGRTQDIPAPPNAASFTANAVSATSINTAWVAPAQSSGLSFRLAYLQGSTAPAVRCASGTLVNIPANSNNSNYSALLQNLIMGNMYSLRLCTMDSGGRLSDGLVASASLVNVIAPPNPANVLVRAVSENAIRVTWSSGGGSTYKYRIVYVPGLNAPANCTSSSGTLISENQISGTLHEIGMLNADTTYTIRLCALDGNNSPNLSSGVTGSAKTFIPPGQNMTNNTAILHLGDRRYVSQYLRNIFGDLNITMNNQSVSLIEQYIERQPAYLNGSCDVYKGIATDCFGAKNNSKFPATRVSNPGAQSYIMRACYRLVDSAVNLNSALSKAFAGGSSASPVTDANIQGLYSLFYVGQAPTQLQQSSLQTLRSAAQNANLSTLDQWKALTLSLCLSSSWQVP